MITPFVVADVVRSGDEILMADGNTTWADEHPEVAALFARDPIPWPCEQIDAHAGPVAQPCLAMGRGEALYASGHLGHLFHSVDQGVEGGVDHVR